MANPKTTALSRDAAYKAKQMYEERDVRGRRVWSIQAIADFLGVGETTAYRAIKSIGPYQSLPEAVQEDELSRRARASAEELAARLRAEGLMETDGSAIGRMRAAIADRNPNKLLDELQREEDEDASRASDTATGTN